MSSRCGLCRHPVSSHQTQPDGTRPCRSIGHPDGLTCADCRAATRAGHVERLAEMRASGDAYEAAWAAYSATYNHFKHEVPEWRAFFTDHHQSALAAALLAYRETEGEAQ